MVAQAPAARPAVDAPPSGSWRDCPEPELPPILTAALDDFKRLGYHGTTVRGIAAGVGLTMPSLYYHYGNKEGILFALLDLAMDDLLNRLELSQLEAGDDPVVRFENFVTAIALHNTHLRDLSSLHDEFRFLGPDRRAEYVDKRSIVEEILVDVLETGIKEGLFTDEDPSFTSRVLLGMLSGILDWYRPSGPLSAEEIAERYMRDALRMVLNSHAPRSPQLGS